MNGMANKILARVPSSVYNSQNPVAAE